MNDIVLSGLDGTNPLGFLAALGTLRVLEEQGLAASLRWELRDVWRPVVTIETEQDGLVEALVADLDSWRVSAEELELKYERKGKLIYELKPPPDAFQSYAREAAEQALSGSRRWADHVAAYAAAHAGLGVDASSGESTKPTALHFSAGGQRFLKAVRDLRAELTREDFQEGLFGPWMYERTLPVLGWDPLAGERDYALRATNPSGRNRRPGVPGADWLGFRSLPFFPVVLCDGVAATTAFEGSGKRYSFHWVLWTDSLGMQVAHSVLASRWDRLSPVERATRGIVLSLCASVRRTDNGGHGSFGAASVE